MIIYRKENKLGLSNEELLTALLENLGGVTNVEEVSMDKARLRFKLKSHDCVKEENLKKLNGVNGIIDADGYYYIVLDESRTIMIFNEFKDSNPNLVLKEMAVVKESFLTKLKSFFTK